MSKTVELKVNDSVANLMLKRPPVNALDETGLYDLMKVVGKALTAELLLFGEKISAVRAQTIGLVNQIKSSADLMPFALASAERIAAKPPMAVHYAKAALQGDVAEQSQDQANWEVKCFTAVWGGREWEEGISRLFKSNKKLEYS
jgi:enoyl-CoA hydratase/carnithine racemase